MTPKEYMMLVHNNPRPYDVVTLWTLKNSRGCPHCDVVNSEYHQSSYSFEASTKEQIRNKKVFFVSIYYNKDDNMTKIIYKMNDINTIPYICVSPMDLKRDSTRNDTGIFTSDNMWLVGSNEVHDASKIIEFTNTALRTDVQIRLGIFTILFNNIIGFMVLVILFQFVKTLYPFLMNQFVWFGVAITVFVVCTGGIVYTMINNVPVFKFERNDFGQVVVAEFFMRGQRGQYGGEGYIASVFFTTIGLVYLYLTKIPSLVPDKHQQRITIVLTLLSLFILQKVFMIIYRFKSPWYNPTFAPPSYYQQGPLASDQGNNI
jgi:hypothetical protein